MVRIQVVAADDHRLGAGVALVGGDILIASLCKLTLSKLWRVAKRGIDYTRPPVQDYESSMTIW